MGTRCLVWTGLLGGLAAVACSAEQSAPPGPPSAASCTLDTECPAGSYCRSGACGQDCTPGVIECPAGTSCGSDGRCIAPMTTGGTGAGGAPASTGGTTPITIAGSSPGGGGTGEDPCARAEVELAAETPSVLFLVDRSGSMADEIEPGISRWTALREALVDPITGLVPSVQAGVNLGLALYTSPDEGRVGDMATEGGTDPDFVQTMECPYLVQVPVALDNAAAIEAAYRPIMMSEEARGHTPTGESMEAMLPALLDLDPALFPGQKVLVLATDGEPDLCEDSNDENGGRNRSVDVVRAAYQMGVTTFVISVGDQVGDEHLRRIANLGQGFSINDTTDRFYRATNAAELAQAFEEIVDGVRTCVFSLDGSVTGDGGDGTVNLDGSPLMKDDANGWRLVSPTEVEFLGTTCDLIKSGDHSIDVSFPCESFVPTIPT